jgi:hypothetical protein
MHNRIRQAQRMSRLSEKGWLIPISPRAMQHRQPPVVLVQTQLRRYASRSFGRNIRRRRQSTTTLSESLSSTSSSAQQTANIMTVVPIVPNSSNNCCCAKNTTACLFMVKFSLSNQKHYRIRNLPDHIIP